MAIYRAGGLAGGISGAIGGVVFVEAKGSKVIRHRPPKLLKSTRPRSLVSVDPKSALTRAIRGWTALSTAAQAAWKTEASNITFPNRLGQRRNISGYNLYVKINTLRARNNTAILTPGPDTFKTPQLPAPVLSATVALGVQFVVKTPVLPVNRTLIIYGAIRWNEADNAYFHDFKWLGLKVSTSLVPTFVTNIWTPVFGPLRLGQRISLQIVPWELTSSPGTPLRVSTTITA